MSFFNKLFSITPRRKREIATAFAIGGDIVETKQIDGKTYRIHTFTTVGSSSLVFNSIASTTVLNSIEYLVVAGGGSGGGIILSNRGSGGGGGGVVSGSLILDSPQTFTVVVGAGGVSGSEEAGKNSDFGSITAYGGASLNQNFTNRGGGYGGSQGNGGIGVQGKNGGNGGIIFESEWAGGGGGGAGSPGTDRSGNIPGNGGNGVASSINGVLTYYGGGGAGGRVDANAYNALMPKLIGSGGLGGGGGTDFNQKNGLPNTGGGGAGGTQGLYGADDPGSGGSGIVIIRYLLD